MSPVTGFVMSITRSSHWTSCGVPGYVHRVHSTDLDPIETEGAHMTATPHVLMVVTSNSKLADTGRSTGLWVEELAAPYQVFQKEGFTIDIASPKGAVRRSTSSASPGTM